MDEDQYEQWQRNEFWDNPDFYKFEGLWFVI